MRVLITGATGFVGSHLARLLCSEGRDVHALIRPNSDLFRIADFQDRLRIVRGDFLNLDPLLPILRSIKPDICIHLAWYAQPGEYLHSLRNVDLIAGTVKFAAALAEVGCRRFVGTGTCFEYETDRGYLREDGQLRPAFLYSAAKAGTFLTLNNLGLATLTFAWARLFYMYGPYEDDRRLVPSVICSMLRGVEAKCTSGEQVRDFLHVQDVAAAIWAIALSSVSGAINVGSGSPVSVAGLVNLIADIVGRPDLVRLGAMAYAERDPPFVCADNRKLLTETAWRPQLALREGLAQTIEWWRARVSSTALGAPTPLGKGLA